MKTLRIVVVVGLASALSWLLCRPVGVIHAAGSPIDGQAITGQAIASRAVAGQAITDRAAAGKAVGSKSASKQASASNANDHAGAVTWSHDVAAVLYKNCSTCHHAGGAGPFPLLTYADAKRWAPQILQATQSRFMPPWLPEPGYGDFADVRRLSDDDVALVKRWVTGGMAEGDLKAAPPDPHYDQTWQMGKPDLVLKVDKPFTLAAGGTDVFRNLVLPYPLKETHYVRAMEIKPGAPQVVHHANLVVDRTGSLRKQHPNDWQDGVPGMELLVDAGNKFDPDSHFLFWKPDTPVLVEPEGMPWRLDAGNDLILNIHLKPSGKAETLDAQIGLYFTDQPPVKQPMLIALERDDKIDIPAGDKDFKIDDELTLPVDVNVLGAYPHAHYLGHDMQGWAILPNGEKKWLVWIKNWDIDRQSVYRYKEPLFLPKGTTLHMLYSYDNSAGNIHNPHATPVRVRAGNRSEDEMGHLWLQVLPTNVPGNGTDPRLQLEEAWMRRRLEKTPNDQVDMYNLASALAGQEKFTEAAALFDRQLKLDAKNVRVLTALGAAQEGAGLTDKAQSSYESAVEMAASGEAGGCDARFDLARLRVRQTEYADAEKAFRALLTTCPEDAEIRSGLGAALLGAGRTDEAVKEFKRALELDAGDFTGLYNLGVMDADAGHVEDAVKELEAALASWPGSVDTHEKLAAMYAQLGRLPDALVQLRAAAELAPNDAGVHDSLAQVLDASGQSEEAFGEQKRALELNPKDADGWNNLGAMLARGKQTAAARSAFEKALQIEPDHAQAKANLARLLAGN